jgi:hypothetical protein
MFILARLISRGSRSLGVMLGSSRKGAGHALGCRESECDVAVPHIARAFFLLPLSLFHPLIPNPAAALGRRGRLLV